MGFRDVPRWQWALVVVASSLAALAILFGLVLIVLALLGGVA